MSSIFWNSTSINNYFNTSLGNPNYSFGNVYSALNDASLIKSGTYGKLMDSYFSTVKSSDASDSASNTDNKTSSPIKNTVLDDLLSHEKKESTVKNTVLDELLSDEPKKSTIKNTVLDKLLSKDDPKTEDGTVIEKNANSSSVAATYTSDATKTAPQTSSVLNELV